MTAVPANSYSSILTNWENTLFVLFVFAMLLHFAKGFTTLHRVVERGELASFYRGMALSLVAFAAVFSALIYADAPRVVPLWWFFIDTFVVFAVSSESQIEPSIRAKWLRIGAWYSVFGLALTPVIVLGEAFSIATLNDIVYMVIMFAFLLVALLCIVDEFSGKLGPGVLRRKKQADDQSKEYDDAGVLQEKAQKPELR